MNSNKLGDTFSCSAGTRVLFVIVWIIGMIAWHAPNPIQAGSPQDLVLARVNDTLITEAMLSDTIQKYEKKQGKRITDHEKKQILNNLIVRHLILQDESFKALKNDQDIIRKVREYEQELMIMSFLKDQIYSRLQVTDEEVKEYYSKNRHEFFSSPKVVAHHILLRNREEAENVLSKLQEGLDFAELAKQYSIDLPMALEGGPMGTIEKGKTLPELEKELFRLKDGETSGIVKTRFGYHILKVDENIPSKVKSFEEVKNLVKKRILKEKEAKAYQDMTEKLKKGADIVIFEETPGGIQREGNVKLERIREEGS